MAVEVLPAVGIGGLGHHDLLVESLGHLTQLLPQIF
jgi:hypothetical protein